MFSMPGRRISPALIALVGAVFIVLGLATGGLAVVIIGLAFLAMAGVQYLLGAR